MDICVRLDSQIARYPSFSAFIIANPFDEFGGCFFSNNYKKMKADEFLSEYVFEDEGNLIYLKIKKKHFFNFKKSYSFQNSIVLQYLKKITII